MTKNVLVLCGAGQIGLAITRRVASGKKIVIGDKNESNAQHVETILNEAGFDAISYPLDLASKPSILQFIKHAQHHGPITTFINAAGVSPSQASIETILDVDLVGTACLLEEIGHVIEPYGTGVTISSQSGYRMAQLTQEEDTALATTPVDQLKDLPLLQINQIQDTLHAYQLAKRCSGKRVMAQAVKWGQKKARLNAISPGIIVTPLALDEFNGPRGDFYKEMFAKSPAGRPGTADEVAHLAALLLSEEGAFITGSDFLIDGGATAQFFYGDFTS